MNHTAQPQQVGVIAPRHFVDRLLPWRAPTWSPSGTSRLGEIVVDARLGATTAYRVFAITQTAVYEAVNAITKRYPASGLKLEARRGPRSMPRSRRPTARRW